MKYSKRFNDAIDALVKGYMNGTLAKGVCTACAVGNIVAKAMKCEIIKNGDVILWKNRSVHWGNVFTTTPKYGQSFNLDNYVGNAKKEIDSTGYTCEELAKIEFAFERNTEINFGLYKLYFPEIIDKDQLNGLYAVVDVLCEIEGITELSEVEELKEMFVK